MQFFGSQGAYGGLFQPVLNPSAFSMAMVLQLKPSVEHTSGIRRFCFVLVGAEISLVHKAGGNVVEQRLREFGESWIDRPSGHLMENISDRRAKTDYGERWVEHLLGRRWPCAMRHHGDGIGLPLPSFGRDTPRGVRAQAPV